MHNLRVTLIQADLHWQNPEANRHKFSRIIEGLDRPGHIVVLPEMFTTGFTMEAASFAETPDGPTIQWMRQTAKERAVVLVGSLIIREGASFFNRLYWVPPQGPLAWYDKRHLFRMAGEHTVYRAGQHLVTMELRGWKIRPFICYDLRFPVWSRNVNLQYDLALYVANWPWRRINAWRSLLQARAAENQAYVVGVNRVGKDGEGIEYSGDSLAVDAVGNILADLGQKEQALTVELSAEALQRYREKFPAWQDADRFQLLKSGRGEGVRK